MDFCARTIYKRSGSTHSGVATVEKPVREAITKRRAF